MPGAPVVLSQFGVPVALSDSGVPMLLSSIGNGFPVRIEAGGMPVKLVSDDEYARTKPAGFPTLPINLVARGAPGTVAVDGTAYSAFLNTNAAIVNPTVLYVKPSTGSNANSGTSPGSPFQTVTHALRTSTAGSIVKMLEDAVIDPLDLRSTDASQATQQAKLLDGNGYNLILRVTGPDLATATWTRDGTNTNCFTTTLSLGASGAVNRVLRTDGVDEYGFEVPFRSYASAALLNAATDNGFFWDSVGKVLWINFNNGADVQANRSILKGLYTNSGNTARNFVSGAALCIANCTLDGIQNFTIDAGGRLPQIWMHNVTQKYAVGKGGDLTNTGLCIYTNSLVYGSQADGVNAFATSVVGKGLVQIINSRLIRNGDTRTFAANGTLQGASTHGGSNACYWGVTADLNNGQGFADTCVNSSDDISWLASCSVTGGQTTSANYNFGSAATTSSRKAYLDTCQSLAPPVAGDLAISANATVYSYSTTLPTVTGGSVTAYTPSSPP